ncbi:MAG TPA: oligopeptide/dipeptide ABC transporter ATP-binding protein [Alphaproteobacteria bacterium]|nr:oligopeptide/dipeptide ABC transporter ATP-binding protein [Alphaproteobacteria bacterium]
MSEALLEVRELTKHYPIMRGLFRRTLLGAVRAVDGVSFAVHAGETFAIVGESGCGKTTLANLILGLLPPTGGEILLQGRPLSQLTAAEFMAYRRSVAAVFQDPYGALNPRMRVGDIAAEPLEIHGYDRQKRRSRVRQVLQAVGLPEGSARRFPHEFSGGQKQRIGIARALVLEPQLIVLDEPVSSLDVSIRSQILNLLKDLQQELGIAYLLISHDLATVEHMSDWIGVMYLGKLVEVGRAKEVCRQPKHPYTATLVAAATPPGQTPPWDIPISGDVPSLLATPRGCSFHPRCAYAMPVCSQSTPSLIAVEAQRQVACHLYPDVIHHIRLTPRPSPASLG